jgi:uncharacterized protein (TIGR04255 family)
MKPQKHYSRAPINEAVIDLRVDLPPDVTLEALAAIRVGEETAYPRTGRRGHVQWKVSLAPEIEPTSTDPGRGHVFSSEDTRQVFQARLDGFSFSRLTPYDRWDSFRDEARRLWARYRALARPEAVTRIAVRYINRLDLPLPLSDLKDYLRTLPEVSPDLPQALSACFMQLQIPQDDLKSMLILNEAIIPPPRPEVVSVLLDIDLFRDVDVPSDEEALWALFEDLHVRKNDVFEASITDRTRELFA